MAHEEFQFESSNCVYTLQDKGGKKITLSWTSTALGQYAVTVASVGGTKGRPYSLYSLGVQNRAFDVHVSSITGAGATLLKPDMTTPIPKNGNVFDIPMTNQVSPANPKPVDSNICFLSFTADVCTLTILSDRKMVSTPMKKTGLTGHDTVPEPPTSGSEN